MCNRKSQMELMGIAFVVLIVFVGFLLYVKFSVRSEQPDIKKEFTDKQQVENTLSVLLGTTTDCNEMDVRKLIYQLSQPEYYECSPGITAEQATCEILKKILPETYGPLKKAYEFNINKISIGGKEVPVLSLKYCGQEKPIGCIGENINECGQEKPTGCTGEKTTATQQLSLTKEGGGILLIELSICS